MTNGEALVRELINTKKEIKNSYEKLDEIELNLIGMELVYQGKYAIIEYIDSNSLNVNLYVEDENGNSESVLLSIEELLSLVSSK